MKESEAVELKRSLADLKDGLISIAAILNKHGAGELWFGVKNTGVAVGLAKIFIASFDRPSFAEVPEWATQETTQETTQERILACIKADPGITRKQIAAKVGLTEDGIKYHLTKLTKSGVICHVGSTKAGRWEVKG